MTTFFSPSWVLGVLFLKWELLPFPPSEEPQRPFCVCELDPPFPPFQQSRAPQPPVTDPRCFSPFSELLVFRSPGHYWKVVNMPPPSARRLGLCSTPGPIRIASFPSAFSERGAGPSPRYVFLSDRFLRLLIGAVAELPFFLPFLSILRGKSSPSFPAVGFTLVSSFFFSDNHLSLSSCV